MKKICNSCGVPRDSSESHNRCQCGGSYVVDRGRWSSKEDFDEPRALRLGEIRKGKVLYEDNINYEEYS